MQKQQLRELGLRPTNLTLRWNQALGEEKRAELPSGVLAQYVALSKKLKAENFSGPGLHPKIKKLMHVIVEGRKKVYGDYEEKEDGTLSIMKNGKLWTLKGYLDRGGICLNFPGTLTIGDETFLLIRPPTGYFRLLGEQMLVIVGGEIWAFNF